jgi:hypothetical protein
LGTGNSETGRLALRVADLIRQLLGAIALGQFVSWISGWQPNASPTQTWLSMATKLPFSSSEGDFPITPITDLLTQPDVTFATIEGTLGRVTIVHRGQKAISSAAVTDDAGNSVTVTIPFIKFDSGGMTPGSFVRISGTWQTQSNEVDGAALLIDRRNLNELGQQTWRDWAMFQLRPIFEAIPHGLAAQWSWEPGIDGAGNQLRHDTWYVK